MSQPQTSLKRRRLFHTSGDASSDDEDVPFPTVIRRRCKPMAIESDDDDDDDCELHSIESRGRNDDGIMMFYVSWTDGAKSHVPFDDLKDTAAELLAEFETEVETDLDREAFPPGTEPPELAQWNEAGDRIVGYVLVAGSTKPPTMPKKISREKVVSDNNTDTNLITPQRFLAYQHLRRYINQALETALSFGNPTVNARDHSWWLRRAVMASKLSVVELKEPIAGKCKRCGTVSRTMMCDRCGVAVKLRKCEACGTKKVCSYRVRDQDCETFDALVGRSCRLRIRAAKELVLFLDGRAPPKNDDEAEEQTEILTRLLAECVKKPSRWGK